MRPAWLTIYSQFRLVRPPAVQRVTTRGELAYAVVKKRSCKTEILRPARDLICGCIGICRRNLDLSFVKAEILLLAPDRAASGIGAIAKGEQGCPGL